MKDYVLDANALVRFFRKQDGAAKVRELLNQADKKLVSLSISVVNIAEVLYVYARYSTLDEARKSIRKVQGLVEFVSPDIEQALAAAELRFVYKLGLADCFAAELAMRTGATLVTADPEFAKLGKQLKILALPRHKV
ncbi:MAG: type II toxin-antitoxin system VapC family toxin [Terracidiphilus sp.]|jgi:predicted nucleic acid-binding protein